jgi:hypothetical protein
MKSDASKTNAEKIVKSQFFYGSLYQQLDQKYIGKPEAAPESLKSWEKSIKTIEWNRNPENVHTKKAKNNFFITLQDLIELTSRLI